MDSMLSGGFLQVIDMSTHSLSNCMLIMNQLPQVLYRSSNAMCCAINVVCPVIHAAIYAAAAIYACCNGSHFTHADVLRTL